jgi:hypothetical protein
LRRPNRRLASELDRSFLLGYSSSVDWFAQLAGFSETSYEETRANLEVEGEFLRSRVNGQRYRIGTLELLSLKELRQRVQPTAPQERQLKARVILADVRDLLAAPENEGALFQVASQFNLLEMVSPHVTPEDGVAGYLHDHTQGPACAVAAGAATIFRNYFVPFDGNIGQTSLRQLDGLADLAAALSQQLGVQPQHLWTMKNGYVLPTRESLSRIENYLEVRDELALDDLRCRLRIGVQWDVEVTQAEGKRPIVSQAFCSALPVSYSAMPREEWRRFASLVLEAAYEATLLASAANMQRGASNVVFLTFLGGGAFGNKFKWISAAIRRALACCSGHALDVRLVSYDLPDRDMMAIVEGY